MNFLTGASACARKAIYEFLVQQNAEGDNYEDRIKSLKTRYPSVDPVNFDVLAHIKDMTSEKVHEQSWDRWDSQHLTLMIEALKVILYEIYVLPKQRSEQTGRIQQLLERVMHKKPSETPPEGAS